MSPPPAAVTLLATFILWFVFLGGSYTFFNRTVVSVVSLPSGAGSPFTVWTSSPHSAMRADVSRYDFVAISLASVPADKLLSNEQGLDDSALPFTGISVLDTSKGQEAHTVSSTTTYSKFVAVTDPDSSLECTSSTLCVKFLAHTVMQRFPRHFTAERRDELDSSRPIATVVESTSTVPTSSYAMYITPLPAVPVASRHTTASFALSTSVSVAIVLFPSSLD